MQLCVIWTSASWKRLERPLSALIHCYIFVLLPGAPDSLSRAQKKITRISLSTFLYRHKPKHQKQKQNYKMCLITRPKDDKYVRREYDDYYDEAPRPVSNYHGGRRSSRALDNSRTSATYVRRTTSVPRERSTHRSSYTVSRPDQRHSTVYVEREPSRTRRSADVDYRRVSRSSYRRYD